MLHVCCCAGFYQNYIVQMKSTHTIYTNPPILVDVAVARRRSRAFFSAVGLPPLLIVGVRLLLGVRDQGPIGAIKPSRQLCPRIGWFAPAVSAVRKRRLDLFAFSSCSATPAPLSGHPYGLTTGGKEMESARALSTGRAGCLA